MQSNCDSSAATQDGDSLLASHKPLSLSHSHTHIHTHMHWWGSFEQWVYHESPCWLSEVKSTAVNKLEQKKETGSFQLRSCRHISLPSSHSTLFKGSLLAQQSKMNKTAELVYITVPPRLSFSCLVCLNFPPSLQCARSISCLYSHLGLSR